MAEAHRLPKDFDVRNPGKEITDPERAAGLARGQGYDVEYPKHLVRPAYGLAREVVIAHDARDERQLRAQGYMSHQEADLKERGDAKAPPPAVKPVAARKPPNRRPTPIAELVE